MSYRAYLLIAAPRFLLAAVQAVSTRAAISGPFRWRLSSIR